MADTIDNARIATLILVSYQHEDYIQQAVESALAQDFESLEIIISDDSSRDNTYKIIQNCATVYRGRHLIKVRRNEVNMGVVAHLNQIMELASGQFIIIMAGDDISTPDRVAKCVHALRDHDVYAVFSDAEKIDVHGMPLGPLYGENYTCRALQGWEAIIKFGSGGVTGCVLAWRKEVFGVFGPLPTELFAEDQAIPFRATLLGVIKYLPEKLVQYRMHHSNSALWQHQLKSGNWRELLSVRVKKLQKVNRDVRCSLADLDRFWVKLAVTPSKIQSAIIKRSRLKIISNELSIGYQGDLLTTGRSARLLISIAKQKGLAFRQKMELLLWFLFPKVLSAAIQQRIRLSRFGRRDSVKQ